jgi:septal ring factor EnvC (AmiA/AmiB activator)
MRRPRKIAFIGAGAAALIAAAAIFAVGHRLSSERAAAGGAAAEAERARKEMAALYGERAEFIESWAAQLKAAGVSQARIEAIQGKLKATRDLPLATQEDFDRFDLAQTQATNEIAEAIQLADKRASGPSRAQFSKQLLAFERLELALVRKRRDYHQAAFQQREFAEAANHAPLPWQQPLPLAPVFKAEALLRETQRREGGHADKS